MKKPKLNYSLLFTLILIKLLPTIYTTVRISFLGNLPDDWGFNIASQLAWVNVAYEVVQEALILPLFYLIGKSIAHKSEIENKLKSGILTSFGIYCLFSIFLFVFARQLLVLMAQKKEILEASVAYIKIESIAIMLSILSKFILIFFIVLKKVKPLIIILIFQMCFTIMFDIFLVSPLPVSLSLGLNGIALANILVNVILFAIGVVLLKKESINIFSRKSISFSWQREWLKIGRLSGLESLVRNFAFVVMILKMVNLARGQGIFWVANHFIWGWLLLPVIALGDLIKQNTGERHETAETLFFPYIKATVAIILLWLATIPLWKSFLFHIMNVKGYETVYGVVIVSLGFYVVFGLNNVVDSIFYGLGRTDLMLYQSLIVNTLFYGVMFIFFKINVFVPSLSKVAIMFGCGMAFDSIITFIMYFFLRSKGRLQSVGQNKPKKENVFARQIRTNRKKGNKKSPALQR